MLTTLRLNGFKNFRDATVALGPLTLLVGTNAAGKSNVRDAFRFLHGVARGYSLAEIIGEKWGEGGVLQWRGIRGGTREAAFDGTTDFSLHISFITRRPSAQVAEDLGGTDLAAIEYKYSIKVNVGDNGKPARVTRERLKFGPTTVFDSHPSGDPLLSVPHDPDHLPVRMMKGGHRGAYGEKLNCLSVRPALGQVADKARVKEAKVHAKTALAELASMRFLDLDPDALRRPSLPGQTVLGDKGENLSSVLQSICTKPELKVALASWIAELTPMDATDFAFPGDQQGRILVSLIEKGGVPISAYSASDGTLRFLAMIAALLGPESSRFYFFEELDNGIHPARLHLLLGLIERQAERGWVQMVATTHSPELLALLDRKSLENASLVYRLPGNNEGRIVRILDIPGAADLIAKQDLAKLHSTGWLEDAVYFSADDDEPAP
ncbi:AAA family ATPase [uncultured Thiodictyon sp.]|uniref:AAA family ATPase n=1 Tax=uncultured Thiodictyon sp. TaxID=1846217 RepID=UPI0025DF8446|nr:AAA family ATPase [uncultured Thiodictyon sp.]